MLKRDKTPRFAWHLSCSRKLGADKVVLKPSKRGINRGDNEPKDSRVCVSLEPGGCFVAIPTDSDRKFHLYRTYNKVKSYHPYEVDDAKVTQERWLTESKTFIRMHTFSSDDMEIYRGIFHSIQKANHGYAIGGNDAGSLKSQKDARKKINKALKQIGIS
jgi:hypothetical protein